MVWRFLAVSALIGVGIFVHQFTRIVGEEKGVLPPVLSSTTTPLKEVTENNTGIAPSPGAFEQPIPTQTPSKVNDKSAVRGVSERKISIPMAVISPSAPSLPALSQDSENDKQDTATGTADQGSGSSTSKTAGSSPLPTPSLPSLDEELLMSATVRIRCGNIYGSGFNIGQDGFVLTAAHVIIAAIEAGVPECDVIFPRKHSDFGYYSESYYRRGVIVATTTTAAFYKEKGLDVAFLRIIPLGGDPVFPDGFPFIRFPFCGSEILGDKVLLFGYSANVGTSAGSPGSVLSRFVGGILQYADVAGVTPRPSAIVREAFDYFPKLSPSLDVSRPHPVVIIFSDNNFSGASGGLVFDTSKQCIVGVNSAVGTSADDPRIFGVIYNFEFPEIKSVREGLWGPKKISSAQNNYAANQ